MTRSRDLSVPSPGQAIRVAVDLRLRDVDRLDHVTTSVYHDLLTEARRRLFAPLRTAERAFVMVHVELSHRREVRLEAQRVEVTARVVSLGVKSVTVAQEILLPNGDVAAEGRSILVAWDIARHCSHVLDPNERHTLSSFIPATGEQLHRGVDSQPLR
jgi:acyl-CoA thioester hydrolase